MAAVLKPGWSKPSTILFASEIPANEKAFAFALAQAKEFGSDLILFHAYDTLVVAASETSGIRYYDYAAAARSEKQHLEPLARARSRSGPPLRGCGAAGAARRRNSGLHARARDRPDRDGHALAGPDRQAAGGLGGRGGVAHGQFAGVHRRPRGGGRQLSQLCHAHHSLRRQPARGQHCGGRVCRGAGRAARRAPDPAARDPAPGARGVLGRPFAGRGGSGHARAGSRQACRASLRSRPLWCRATRPKSCSTRATHSRRT